MTTSPIRSSSRPSSSPSQAPVSEAEPVPPARPRSTPDAATPPPLRRRTSSGRVAGVPRRTGTLPTTLPGTPDSLASMRSLSSFEDWAHQWSPARGGPSQASPVASREDSADRGSGSSLPSLRSLGSLGSWDLLASPSHDATSSLPSLRSLGSVRSWDPFAGATGATPSGSPRTRPREASLDSVDFDDEGGHPERVRADDEASVEKLIGLLDRVVRGETSSHIGMEAHDATFLIGFDRENQLLPRGRKDAADRLHDRLDRLAEGGAAHRALHRRFLDRMRAAGEPVWNTTQRRMNAVMDACAVWGREPARRRQDMAAHVASRHGPDLVPMVLAVVLKGGIFKAVEHHDKHAEALRAAVDSLATQGIEQYAADLERWRAFELRQRPAALQAALHVQRRSDQSEREGPGLIAAADKLVEQLEVFGAAEHGSISHVSGTSQSATLLKHCDKTGALKDVGRLLLDRLQRVDPARAERLRQASIGGVAGWLRRATSLVDELTAAVRQIKSGTTKNALCQSMPRETLRDRHIVASIHNMLTADGNGFRAMDKLGGMPDTLERLSASDDPAHHASLAAFRQALMADHPVPGVDPIAELLQSRRAMQAQRQADAPHRRLPQAAGASALPPRAARRRPSVAHDRRSAPTPPQAQSPEGRAASPTPSMAWPGASLGPDLNDLPPTPDIDFLPPLHEPDEADASIDAMFAANAELPRWLQPLLHGMPHELAVELLNGAMEFDAHLASLNQPSLQDLLVSDRQHLLDLAGRQRRTIVLALLDRQAALRAFEEHGR